jgi:predicted exporter
VEPTDSPLLRLVTRFIAAVQRRATWVLAGAAVLTALGGILASQLELHTSFAELLPSRDPGLTELRRIEDRLGGFESLIVAIESPDRDANLRYAAALCQRIRALAPDLVDIARFEARAEQDFFERHKWLYPDVADLETVRDRLHDDILRQKDPLYVPLDEGESWDALKARLSQRRSFVPQLPDGYFQTPDGHLVTVMVIPPGGLFGRSANHLYREVQRIVRELPPERFHPHMTAGLSGDIATEVEERRALEHDLFGATALAVTLVCLAVVGFYGRVRALPLMATPAAIGVALAFALAQLAFGYLNSSTAFLGSIIMGNGINFAIIQLARYEEERRAGAAAREAGIRAVVTTIRATAVAAGAASISYGSLLLTRFRGFSQFGLIGGAGMLLAWLGTITVLPALLYLLDCRRPPQTRKPAPGLRVARPLANLAVGHPGAMLTAGLLVTAAAAAVVPRYLRDPFEYDFRNLRTVRAVGRGYHSQIDGIFGRVLSPTPILTDRAADAPMVARLVMARDAAMPGPNMVTRAISIDELLPGTPEQQQQKLAVLGEIRALGHDPLFKLLDDQERTEFAKWQPPPGLAPITLADLPDLMLHPFRERDGTIGRVVLVFPDMHNFSSWNGRDLMRMARVIGVIPLPDGRTVRSSGHAVVFAAMIRSIVHDAPIATLASLCGVAALVVLLCPRLGGAALVLGALVFGVVWLVGAAAAAHERVNFLNFIALPITFGIGVDYGINIYLRWVLEQTRPIPAQKRVHTAVVATGGAVALCSTTTVIGYSALLVAQNRALRSFGGMAILGELCTLAAALVFMPAYLAWVTRSRARGRPILPQPAKQSS